MRRLALCFAICASSAAAAAPPGQGHRAVVLLDEAVLPDPAKLAQDFQTRWKRSIKPTRSANADMLTFDLEDGDVSIELRRYAVPDDEFRAAAHRSWQWPEAPSVTHRAQLNIKVKGPKGDATDNLLRLTRVVASVVATCPAKAVYWGNANMMIEPKRFVRDSSGTDRDNPPIVLWVNALPAVLPDSNMIVRTVGMPSANLPDLVLVQGKLSDEAAVTFVISTAEYLVSHPGAAKPGVLKPTKKVTLSLVNMPSPWNPAEKLLRIVPKN